MTASGPRPQPSDWLRDLRRAASWHRRLLVAGLLAASVAFAIQAVTPPPPRTEPVLVAARDLAGGTRVTVDDIRLKGVAPGSLPHGALRSPSHATGRTLGAPVRKGEVLTDVRLVSRALLDSYGDALIAAPVRIADAASVRLIGTGDIVDVLAAGPGLEGSTTSEARVVAAATPVIAIPPPTGSPLGDSDAGQGALVVIVTSSQTAARLAAAAVTDRLSLVIHGK